MKRVNDTRDKELKHLQDQIQLLQNQNTELQQNLAVKSHELKLAESDKTWHLEENSREKADYEILISQHIEKVK